MTKYKFTGPFKGSIEIDGVTYYKIPFFTDSSVLKEEISELNHQGYKTKVITIEDTNAIYTSPRMKDGW